MHGWALLLSRPSQEASDTACGTAGSIDHHYVQDIAQSTGGHAHSHTRKDGQHPEKALAARCSASPHLACTCSALAARRSQQGLRKGDLVSLARHHDSKASAWQGGDGHLRATLACKA